MTKAERTVNLIAVVLPFVAFLAAIVLLWNSYVGVERPRRVRRHVPDRRLRRDGRLPPPADPPRVPDAQADRVRLRDRRLDVGAGPGHRLGRRPPQAPRAHRRGGRPALAARRHGSGVMGALKGLWHAHIGLAVRTARPGRARSATPRTSSRTAACAAINRRFLAVGRCSASRSRSRSASLLGGTLARRAAPACSGAASCASSCCTT